MPKPSGSGDEAGRIGALPVVAERPAPSVATTSAVDAKSGTAGTGKRGFTAEVVEDRAAIDRLLPEWQQLFESSRCGNPFSDPTWVLAWLEAFASSERLFFVLVRRSEELVGVAPFYLRAHRLGPLRARSVRLLGTGRDASVTEVAQILIAPGLERAVLSSVVGALEERV